MATTKNIKRTFESELQSLPIQLVPPDPLSPVMRQKSGQHAALNGLTEQPEIQVELLTKLISKIKRI